MNELSWRQAIEASRNGNDTLFSKAVSSSFEEHFSKAIQKITQDKRVTKEIYISTMTKFWERFILCGEDLPKSNINGYIFQMAKNAFFEIKRKKRTYKHSFIQSVDILEIVEKYNHVVTDAGSLEATSVEQQEDITINQIHAAVQSLDPRCQQIIEKNIIKNISLTQLKKELGIDGTYNAIVQKKKRCLSALKKRLFTLLNTKSINLEQTTI